MTKPKVLLTRKLAEPILAYLQEHLDCTMWDQEGSMPRAELEAKIHDYEGVMLSGGPINASFLEKAPRLRVVSSVSVGYNHFDIEAMRARRVIGTHTPYVLDDTVADLVLALMLSAGRRVAELDAFVKQGNWKKGGVKEEQLFGMDVHHATVGIIGMGRIGEAIAKRAVHGFDMKLLYHSRTAKPDIEARFGGRFCSLEELLKEADYVVLMTPLSPETAKLIRAEHFDLMKPTAFFINASRGQTVDEQALTQALQQGKIRGAGLDVFELEPVSPDNPLLKLPNVVTLPHIGSATDQTRYEMAKLAAHNLVGALTGGKVHVVPELKELVEA
ncbi:2-hydroxyacid dehydrogenase [Paenibacillus rigui]|uniref:Bifunctional glyoxylate/hydroxypyruvate reductase B n=1 Tax=Paenibacillus rigui TaxID=554312 RepID=A0A229UW80_9BACL|nr:D-glycerate dehydrogenase [Paenibacillus rigui]OXM87817.1 bifunctional glyoxylate/hydroxypyruvate reductase B [Paenibacillus rigui]